MYGKQIVTRLYADEDANDEGEIWSTEATQPKPAH